METKRKLGIFALVLISAMMISLVAAQSYITTVNTEEYGPVTVIIKEKQPNTLFSFIQNLFSVSFSESEVYLGESVDISSTAILLGGTCSMDYWKLYVVKTGGSSTYLGDFHEYASDLGSCNLEIWASFVATSPGDYTARSVYKWVGGSEQTENGDTVTVLDIAPTEPCEMQSWKYFAGISKGELWWKQNKDLDSSDGIDCDSETLYHTYCNIFPGYHVGGYAESVTDMLGSFPCIANGVTETCSQAGGNICTSAAECSGGTFLDASDTSLCCNIACHNGGTCTDTAQACTTSAQCCSGSCVSNVCSLNCANGQTKACTNGTQTCAGGVWGACIADVNLGKSKTITLTQFYSMDNEKFGKTNSVCKLTSDCELAEGYNVTCEANDLFLDRHISILRDACDSTLGWLDELSNILRKIIPFTFQGDICDRFASGVQSVKDFFLGGSPKYCTAKPTTWYMSIWESYLTLLGGLGIPYAWVMMSGIGILIMLAFLLLGRIGK